MPVTQAFAQVWHRRADLKMVALAVLLRAERHAVTWRK